MDFFSGKINKYSEVLFSLAREDVFDTYEEDAAELGRVIKNTLLDLPGPRVMAPKKLGDKERFTVKLFRPFSEILNSLEAIQNIPVYISRFPYKQNVSRCGYLRYHIGNYLNELYILVQRYTGNLDVIDRIYKKTTLKQDVNLSTTKLRDLIKSTFDKPISVRGLHVHRIRFSDNDVDRLSLIDTYLRSDDKKFTSIMKTLYKTAYNEVRSKWKKQMEKNFGEIKKFNDEYFDILSRVLIKDDQFIFPWDKRRRHVT
ncbi:MAG: hypothetical protein PHH01_02445 [Patescibacteria group bacterium]|nr:hypothetical protein [Patescibacteria group bacterium]